VRCPMHSILLHNQGSIVSLAEEEELPTRESTQRAVEATMALVLILNALYGYHKVLGIRLTFLHIVLGFIEIV